MPQEQIVAQAAKAAGGASALAAALGVQPSAVSNWRRTGIPAARVGAVARATGLSLSFLRPDLFGEGSELAGAPASPEQPAKVA